MEGRNFPVEDALSIVKDEVLSSNGISGICKICSFMLGQELYLSQIPTAASICAPELLRQYPYFSKIDHSGVNEENLREWIFEMQQIFGPKVLIKPFPKGKYALTKPNDDLSMQEFHWRTMRNIRFLKL